MLCNLLSQVRSHFYISKGDGILYTSREHVLCQSGKSLCQMAHQNTNVPTWVASSNFHFYNIDKDMPLSDPILNYNSNVCNSSLEVDQVNPNFALQKYLWLAAYPKRILYLYFLIRQTLRETDARVTLPFPPTPHCRPLLLLHAAFSHALCTGNSS